MSGDDRGDLAFETAEERALADRLRRRAEVVEPGGAGLEAIRSRIGRRRQHRRLVAGGGALVLVLALVVGLLGVMPSPDDQTVVDTDAGATEMPFLGFANDTWQVTTYAPGTSYVAFDSMEGASDDAVILVVTRDGNQPGQTSALGPGGGLAMERSPERTIEGPAGPRQVGIIRWGSDVGGGPRTGGPGVWWTPSPGWTATLTGNSPESVANAEPLLAAVEAVVDVDRTTWQRHLRSSVGDDVLLGDEPALVLADPAGTTQVVNATLDSVLMWLVPSDGSPPVLLVASGPGVEFSLDGTERRVEVRGRPGHLDEGLDAPERTLSWTEGDRDYIFYLAPGQALEDAVALADQLTMPGIEEWQTLLFPSDAQDYPPELLERWTESSSSSASGGAGPLG